jgi:hypothetical protein
LKCSKSAQAKAKLKAERPCGNAPNLCELTASFNSVRQLVLNKRRDSKPHFVQDALPIDSIHPQPFAAKEK